MVPTTIPHVPGAVTMATRMLGAPSDYPAALQRIFELFVTNPAMQIKPGWQDTAMSWFVAILGVAIGAAVLLLVVQWLRIRDKKGIPERVNAVKRQTKFICLFGVVPLALVLFALRFASDDYSFFINIPGLLNSIAVCLVLYVLSVLAGQFAVLRVAK
jgi:cytochrome bd-type quinol oxidase subunit 2